ncbi:hypothetical protein LVY72_07400 [Arthrobacter sp. I2-34]|uniref:Uncharacterized protein n=1 Tax=Arthrobacter hankyongi TaxID=2904801 RepID=A0ABS9L5J1_9MICC|nr:hypothetical protein [Arthrobacter hankyongi]MCG2621742.1 hypothetical protein [Arthrobacter hankyongi]
MENTARSTPSGHAGPAPAAAGAAFRIRWGRTVLALVGTMAAAAFVTGTLLALLGALPGSVPFTAFLVAAAVVVTLRSLAVRDRVRRARARRQQPRREAAAVVDEPQQPVQRRETVLFNGAESEESPAAGAQPAPLTAEQLRAEALKVAAQAARNAAAAAPGAAWQPVEVPKPTYVAAAKAERPAPEPLPAPEVKKPAAKVNIKQDAALKASAAAEAAAAAATVAQAPAAQAPAAGAPAAPSAAPAANQAANPAAPGTDGQAASPRPQTGKLNLDAVLQRRRA